jgi:tetratricopeptide (TPR) repeat protein
MRPWLAAGIVLAALAPLSRAQEPPSTVNPPAVHADDTSFEGLWAAARRAEAANDTATSERLMLALRRARAERNVGGIEVVALAQVAHGLARLESGDAERAAASFRTAIDLDPQLPEGYLGLAKAELQRGPLGLVGAARNVQLGLTARLGTYRGKVHATVLLVISLLIAVLASLTVFGVCMVLRYGALLRHDIEELFGSEARRPWALGCYAIILLLPVVAQQGYGWLPIWWLAVLFLYLRPVERAVTMLTLALLVAVGPLLWLADNRLEALSNPLFRAALTGVEGAGDGRALRDLERARREDPADGDLAYLIAGQLRKAGRYAEASAIYEELLKLDPSDGVALNNLGNIIAADGARAGYAAAITRYQDGLKVGAGGNDGAGLTTARSARVRATLNYNLYLAYLQVFDFQAAQAARAQAEQAGRGLVRDYEDRWRVEKEGSSIAAFVDLGPTVEQCLAKVAGMRKGVHLRNEMKSGGDDTDLLGLARSLLTRFLAAVAIFLALVLARRAWRGQKAFTLRCLKCGTPFCRHCHLGAAVAGLCTQCYHLFIVRDGVSGPARNQKLLEVQVEDERRERIFRVLSLVSPGAGHVYGQKAMLGLAYLMVWYFLIALSALSIGFISVSEAASALVGPWPVIVALVGLLVVYVLANRARLSFEVVVPVRRGAGRPRARQER